MPNPIEKLKDAAFESVRHPRRTAGQAVGMAADVVRGLVHAGQTVADLVVSQTGLDRHRTDVDADVAPAPEPDIPGAGDEPDHDEHAAPVMRAAAKKTPPPRKKAPAEKAPAKKAPPQKSAKKTAKKTSKKSTAKKSAKKAAKKSPAKKAAPAAQPSEETAPPSAATAASDAGIGEGPDVETPVGTTGAGAASNPDTAETDLQQPGTEPLVDPGTAKAVASEADTMGRAADPEKE